MIVGSMSLPVQDHRDDPVPGNLRGERILNRGQVFMGPNVPHFCRAAPVHVMQVEVHRCNAVGRIEEADRHFASFERTGPYLKRTLLPDAITCFDEGVLIDGDDFGIADDFERFLIHFGDVVAKDERRGHDGPKRHLSSVLVGSHVAVAHFQAVGVVVASGAREGGQASLREADRGH